MLQTTDYQQFLHRQEDLNICIHLIGYGLGNSNRDSSLNTLVKALGLLNPTSRCKLGEVVFLELFKSALRHCVQKSMVKGRRQAMDSVLVKSQCLHGFFERKEIAEHAEAITQNSQKNPWIG